MDAKITAIVDKKNFIRIYFKSINFDLNRNLLLILERKFSEADQFNLITSPIKWEPADWFKATNVVLAQT